MAANHSINLITPHQAIGFEIVRVVYESILRAANITPASGDDAYPALIAALRTRSELAPEQVPIEGADRQPFPGERDAVEVKLGNLFRDRAFRNPEGVGARFKDMTQVALNNIIAPYVNGLDLNADVGIHFKRDQFAGGGFFYLISLTQGAPPGVRRHPGYHITIPEDPVGLGVGHITNYTMHFTDERNRLHVYHRFTTPRGRIVFQHVAAPAAAAAPAAQAAAAQAAAAPAAQAAAVPLVPVVPYARGPVPGTRGFGVPPAAAPMSFAERFRNRNNPKGGKSRRKTRRSKRARRTRRR